METYIVEHEGHELVIDRYPKEKIEELKDRIRLGNKKLNEAWAVIVKMDHSQEGWVKSLEQWHLSNAKLSAYGSQLKNMGFDNCLYIKDGEKYRKCLEEALSCRVCPSRFPWWEREWLELSSSGEK